MGRDSHHEPLAERLAPDAAEPDSDDTVVKMAWYLKTREGKARYAKRKCTVEPVFGIIKFSPVLTTWLRGGGRRMETGRDGV